MGPAAIKMSVKTIAKIRHPPMNWDVKEMLKYKHAQFVIEITSNRNVLLIGKFKCLKN
jgi:hypothetical protein